MNAIDLFQNGAYAAPKSWNGQISTAKQRMEKVFFGAILGNVWKPQKVFVATGTKTVPVIDNNNKIEKKALCDYDTSGSEIKRYCKDGRAYFLVAANALDDEWQHFNTIPGVDKLDTYVDLNISDIMTAAVSVYDSHEYASGSLSGKAAWAFMDVNQDMDLPLYIPLEVCDLDQIDGAAMLWTATVLEPAYDDIVGGILQVSYSRS